MTITKEDGRRSFQFSVDNQVTPRPLEFEANRKAGGKARAESLTAERRSAIAQAVEACWKKSKVKRG